MKLHCSSRYFSRTLAFAGLASVFLAAGSLSAATTYTWIAADGTDNYDGSANWSPTGVPGTGDTALISGSGFDSSLDVRNTTGTATPIWTIGDLDYETASTFSILGRGPTGSIAQLNVTDTLTADGGSFAIRDQATTRFLALTVNDIEVKKGVLSLGSSSNVLTGLSATTANISGGSMNLRSANGGTFTIGSVNFTGGTLNLHGTGASETGTLIVNSLTSSGGVGTITTGTVGAGNTGILSIATVSGSTSTYSGAITEMSSNHTQVTVAGGGTQIFTGSSNYTGGTTINAGTLLINNTAGSGVGSGNVIVQTGGVLGGTGKIGGAVTTVSTGNTSALNGHLSPGSSGAGILTINNTLTLGDHTVLDYDLNTANVTAGTGGNDLLSVLGAIGTDGNVTLGSNIVLNLTAGESFGAGTYDLITFTGTLTGAADLASWTVTGPGGESYTFGSDSDSVFLTVVSVPEPATTPLVIIGAAGLACLLRRKRLA